MHHAKWFAGVLGVFSLVIVSDGTSSETQVWDADSTVTTIKEGRQSKEYFGLRLTSGDLFVTSAHAIYDDWEERLDCGGGVTLHDTVHVVTADRLTYEIKKQRVSAFGNVRFQNRRYRLKAQEVYYERDARSLRANHDVYLEDGEKWIVLTGDQMIYDEVQRTGVAGGRPKLVKEKEGLSMQGGTIRFALNDVVIVAEGEVRIVRKEATASGDTAIYEDKMERLRIKGNVSLFWETEEAKRIERGEMFGKEMVIMGNDTSLSEIHAVGEARLRWTTVHQDSRGNYLSLLKSDSLQIVFQERSKPRSVIARGHATSLHTADDGEEPDRLRGRVISVGLGTEEQTVITAEGDAEGMYRDEKKGEKRGSGRVRGERIRLFMKDQRMTRVEVDGGVAGVYRTE